MSSPRLGFYIDWLTDAQREWYQPDLRAYRDYLLHERQRADKQGRLQPATLSPATVQAHLALSAGATAN